MGVVDDIIRTAQSGRASTTYKVGEKSTSKGLPIDVQLSIDQDFKKTILKGVAIFSGGVALGIAAGFIITKSK
jgi:hypothetical protein